jgi:hypothetical protein
MNPALLSALIAARQADLLRELELAGALREAHAMRHAARRPPAPAARPLLAAVAGGGKPVAHAPAAAAPCLPDPAPKPAA